MAYELLEIPCNFVGNFKVGDNIVYNCELLSDLAMSNEDSKFNKLIVIQVGSILEAVLSEVIFRAQNYNQEGVKNIAEPDRQRIAEKQIDKFAVIIDVLRKYDVLGDPSKSIYDDLHVLRKYRNKVHIQEDIRLPGAGRDELHLFTDELTEWALTLGFRLIVYLSEHLNRPQELSGFVRALRFPRLT